MNAREYCYGRVLSFRAGVRGRELVENAGAPAMLPSGQQMFGRRLAELSLLGYAATRPIWEVEA